MTSCPWHTARVILAVGAALLWLLGRRDREQDPDWQRYWH
jgi:hypothetical protein